MTDPAPDINPNDLADLLNILDEFLRSSDQPVIELLTRFFAARGANNPGFRACNLVDALSFTAYQYRQPEKSPMPTE